MTGPKPVAGPQLAGQTSWASAIRLKDAGGQLADTVFYALVLFCALAILAVVGLVLYELVSKSQLSWHAFGFKFFLGQNWDPVNDQFGALPFIYGTVVSSLLALVLAVPLAIGDVAALAAWTTRLHHRASRRDSQRNLWIVGNLCSSSFASPICSTLVGALFGMDRSF